MRKKKAATSPQHLYQQLLTCVRGDWQSVVVVPAGPGESAAAVADALVEVSALVRGKRAERFSTEGLGVNEVSGVIVELMQHVSGGGLAVATVDPVTAAQAGIPLTMAADAALLVVHLGVTDTEDARRTVELVGSQKFLGAVAVEA